MKRKIFKLILSFFIVMFCCTLIARGASSMTVAKVKTEGIRQGSLTDEFDGEGKIQAKDKIYQSLPEEQKVADILVNPGSTVHAGDGIVRFDMAYLEEQVSVQTQEIEKLRYRMEQQRISSAAPARTPATAQAQLGLDESADALTAAQNAYQQKLNECNAAAARQPSESEEDARELEEKRQQLESELDAAAEALQIAERAYRSAQGAYNIARQDEANNQANDATAAKASQAALSEMQVELTAQQTRLDKLSQLKDAGGIVTAQEDGIFESAGAVEGSITTGTEQIVLVIGNTEACGVIPDDKIATVAAGDEVEVSIQGETKAQMLEISRVGQDEEGKYVWYAPLPRDSYRIGTGLTYHYSRKSDNSYDMLIPLSALRESQSGSYVLTAEIRAGILGESYTAVKVNVTVLKKDDDSAAVETNLPKDAMIITESSKYVKEGDRVRLNE